MNRYSVKYWLHKFYTIINYFSPMPMSDMVENVPVDSVKFWV